MGKLLSVEMFLFLDRIPKSQPPICRVQVVESETGAVLAAELVDEDGLGQKTSRIESLIASALLKRRVPLAERRYIGLIGFRNEEPGHALDGLAEALGMFVMADLDQSPQIIVLDRERLERLAQEKELTGFDQQLRSSAVLLDGAVRRAATGVLAITVTLRSPMRAEGRRVSASAPEQDVIAARKALTAAVAEAVCCYPIKAGPQTDARAESAAFVAECNRLRVDRDFEGAVRAAEAAYALAPEPSTQLCSAGAWGALRRNLAGTLDCRFAELSPAIKARALTATLREQTLFYDLCNEKLRANRNIEDLVRGFSGDAIFVPIQMPEAGELGQLQQETRQAQRRLFQTVLDFCKAHFAERDVPEVYERVWRAQTSSLQIGPPELAAQQVDVLRGAVDAFAHPPADPGVSYATSQLGLLKNLPLAMQLFRRPHNAPPAATRDCFVAFWKEMTKHENPFVRLTAYRALAWANENPQASSREAIRTFIEGFPANHPWRTIGGDGQFQSMLWDSFDILRKSDSVAAAAYAQQILEPWVRERNAERLARWDSIVLAWLDALQAANRLDEADVLAKNIHEILTSANTSHSAIALANNIAQRRTMWATKLAQPTPEDSVWSDYRIEPLRLQGYSPGDPLLVSGNKVYCLSYAGNVGEMRQHARLCVFELPLGGAPLKKQELHYDNPSRGLVCVSAVVRTDNALYAATDLGLEEFPDDARPPRVLKEADGLRGMDISALAYYGGKLYMGLGGSRCGVASYAPDTGEGELIASSVAKDIHSGLDGGDRYRITAILADPERKCLWLAVMGMGMHVKCGGFWRLWPATGKLEQVISDENAVTHAVFCGRDILLDTYNGLVLFNPEQNTSTWLLEIASAPRPPGCVSGPLFGARALPTWPAACDGERLLTGGEEIFLALHRKGADPVLCGGLRHVTMLDPTPWGILAVGIATKKSSGNAWLIRRNPTPEAQAASDMSKEKAAKETQ